MNWIARGFYITSTLAVTFYLFWVGNVYYSLPLEERFYHEFHETFKASGILGHGLGIVGTIMIAFGVFLYIGAKKYGWLTKLVRLKYLLEFHIYLCTLGPILVLFHTTFKFGGIVSIAFWSMVIVVLSGVVGRFLYIRLPRDWQGRELTFADATVALRKLEQKNDPTDQEVQEREKLARQIRSLERNQRFFKYWHIAHRPFALIMLVIVVVHVVATLLLGFGFWR
jgi:hypothetical protein